MERPGLGLSKKCSLELKLYSHVFAVGWAVHFKKLPRVEAKHAGENIGWKGLHARIEVANHGVVITPCILNVVLNGVE